MRALDDIITDLQHTLTHHESEAAHHQAEADRIRAAIAALAVNPNRLPPAPAKTTVRKAATKPPTKKAPPQPPAAKRARVTVDFAEVAQIAREAIERGGSGIDAVASHYGITKGNASVRITTARNIGHDVPKVSKQAAPPADPPAPKPERPTWSPDDAAAVLASVNGDD